MRPDLPRVLREELKRRVAKGLRRTAARIEVGTSGTYAAIALLRERHGYTGLAAHELRVFSQNGEDGVLTEILCRLGIGHGRFVEFGVDGGAECNTRFLAEVLGWSGTYIEPDPESFESLAALHVNRDDIATVQAMVTPENVNQLVDACDLLSIDVDGQDYWIWEAVTVEPAVVVIEYNAALTGRLVEPRDSGTVFAKSQYGGASLDALCALAERKGYVLAYLELAGINAFFVRAEHASLFDPPVRRGPNYWLRGHGHRPADGAYVRV